MQDSTLEAAAASSGCLRSTSLVIISCFHFQISRLPHRTEGGTKLLAPSISSVQAKGGNTEGLPTPIATTFPALLEPSPASR